MSSAPPATTVRLTIDGREVVVPKGTTIYTAAKQAGVEIPTFCYHDRMAPLGACRVCLVEVERMPKLATSCTQEVGDGMVVHTVSEKAQAGQRAILELLLINHPLDCPICDKGGECPLQDNTLKFGPGQSRFVEVKRTYRKHLRMGPTLVLDRERCILCWRCVRFGEIVAGDDALQGFERGYHSQIATPQMAPVHSKFIGNTIEICPVGALTSATYRFRSRPWDNRAVKSVCPHCGCGCTTTLNVRGNDLDRTRSREHLQVNDVWLCDKGFFGYEFVQSPERLTTPLVRRDGELRAATWEEALDRVAAALRTTPAGAVGVIGGARSTNEDNYLLLRLFRGIVGTNSVDFRTDTAHPLPGTSAPWGLPGSIADVENADAIVLVGCDLTEEYPIVWLRVKKAVDRGARLIIVNPWELEIARWATRSLTHRWGAEAAVLEALAGRRDAADAAASSGVPADHLREAARALAATSRPLVLVGRTALERPDGMRVLAAAQALCGALPAAQIGVLRGRATGA
jgi:NADH-quinone oxidoreductase subunit G